jgi:hypothetical protein
VGVGKGWKVNIDVAEALGEVDEVADDTNFSVDTLARRSACDPSIKKEATKSTAKISSVLVYIMIPNSLG